MSAALRVAVVFPDLLGTYGDGGNGLILARRAEWRGYEVELLQAASDRPVPDADLYCLGGGEDGPQVRAARTLMEDATLPRRVAGGAVVLAVCAGFQVAGRVVGTYLHGPVLARNPALADRLLAWALDVEELAPLDDRAAEALREERLAATGARGRFRRRK